MHTGQATRPWPRRRGLLLATAGCKKTGHFLGGTCLVRGTSHWEFQIF